MINELIKLSKTLDKFGRSKEANYLNEIVKKYAGAGSVLVRGVPVSWREKDLIINGKKYRLTAETPLGPTYLTINNISYEKEGDNSKEALLIDASAGWIRKRDILLKDKITFIIDAIEKDVANFDIKGKQTVTFNLV